MPIYSVRSLDVLGNPVDGYEVNDTRDAGEVYIRPSGELGMQDQAHRAYELEVLGALTARGLITEHSGGFEIEFDDGTIEISEVETALAISRPEATVEIRRHPPSQRGSDDLRFVRMLPFQSPASADSLEARVRQAAQNDRARQAVQGAQNPDSIVDVEGMRPVFELEEQALLITPQHWVPEGRINRVFWRVKMGEGAAPDRTPAERVATAFSRILRQEISPADMVTVVQRNRAESNNSVCHSHDFIDANTVMVDAITEATGRHPETDDIAEDLSLWHAAWAIAKQREFQTPHALTITMAYFDVASGARLGVEVMAHELRTDPVVDRFEWPIADWQREPTFGFDPLTSEELTPTKGQYQEIMVALDQYMEKR